ncbi:hypothetical protein Tco_0242388 [Tanacetum coccineum]
MNASRRQTYHFYLHKKVVTKCPAHGGICIVNDTLPELVKLLHGEVHTTTYEAIQTLSTLVEKESPRKGAHVLQESGAVVPILEVLNWGSELSKVEALKMFEKVFMLTKMVDWYGATTRVPLVRLTGGSIHKDRHLSHNTWKRIELNLTMTNDT